MKQYVLCYTVAAAIISRWPQRSYTEKRRGKKIISYSLSLKARNGETPLFSGEDCYQQVCPVGIVWPAAFSRLCIPTVEMPWSPQWPLSLYLIVQLSEMPGMVVMMKSRRERGHLRGLGIIFKYFLPQGVETTPTYPSHSQNYKPGTCGLLCQIGGMFRFHAVHGTTT